MVALKEIFITLIVITIIRYGSGNCNTCNVNGNMACISEEQYLLCVNGIPDISEIYRCPQGQVCTTNNKCGIAASNTPACRLCNVCSLIKEYTCTSFYTYSPCYGTTIIDWEMTCPFNSVCNPAGTKDKPCMQYTNWYEKPLCLKDEYPWTTPDQTTQQSSTPEQTTQQSTTPTQTAEWSSTTNVYSTTSVN
uniref:CSON006967 protein n=1 Tax=Culicoides sonorensis TaxID=179676 RepID=A0A336MXJ2_CULSO